MCLFSRAAGAISSPTNTGCILDPEARARAAEKTKAVTELVFDASKLAALITLELETLVNDPIHPQGSGPSLKEVAHHGRYDRQNPGPTRFGSTTFEEFEASLDRSDQ